MNLSTHLAVGAVVGYATKNPLLGFFAGFASHHIIDQIPHSDGGALNVTVDNFSKDKRILVIVAIDFLILISIAYLFIRSQGFYLPMILGGIGGTVPDLIDNMPFWSGKLRKIYPFNRYHWFHETFHFTIEDKEYVWIGVLIQLLIIGAMLAILI